MGKVYIRTYAYNAERTLRRAVESILAQTYPDFIYYLCDNGSTDSTGQIVEEYARRDSRIKPFHNKVNRNYRETEECLLLPTQLQDEDYFCSLDADDEYLPDFLEKMLSFMEQNGLDIAACGSIFINVSDENEVLGGRALAEDLILCGQSFAEKFTIYHPFMRTVWGKLYKGRTARSMVQDGTNDPEFPKAYGGDTFNAMRAFESADRAGILAGVLHKYFVSAGSTSYRYHPERIKSCLILYGETLRYLRAFGEISLANQDFIYGIYLDLIKSSAEVILTSDISDAQKLEAVRQLAASPYTKGLASWEHFGAQVGQEKEYMQVRQDFFAYLAYWLLSLEEVPDEQAESYCEIGEWVCAQAGFADGWLLFQKLSLQLLTEEGRLAEAREKLEILEDILPEDEDLREARKKIEGRKK